MSDKIKGTLVERVARAIQDAQGDKREELFGGSIEGARAALFAMQEPTPKEFANCVGLAVEVANGDDVVLNWQGLKAVWRCLIDAALNENSCDVVPDAICRRQIASSEIEVSDAMTQVGEDVILGEFGCRNPDCCFAPAALALRVYQAMKVMRRAECPEIRLPAHRFNSQEERLAFDKANGITHWKFDPETGAAVLISASHDAD